MGSVCGGVDLSWGPLVVESSGVSGCEWQAIMFGGLRPLMFGGRRPLVFGGRRPIGGRSSGRSAVGLAIGRGSFQRSVRLSVRRSAGGRRAPVNRPVDLRTSHIDVYVCMTRRLLSQLDKQTVTIGHLNHFGCPYGTWRDHQMHGTWATWSCRSGTSLGQFFFGKLAFQWF